jgi:lipopolysaccharide export system permease protein
VMHGAGLSESRTLLPTMAFVLPWAALAAVITFLLSPTALRLADEIVRQGKRTMAVAGMEPGRFAQIAGTNAVIFVAAYNESARNFDDVMMYSEDPDGKIGVLRARHGEVKTVGEGEIGSVHLRDGVRTDIRSQDLSTRSARFASAEIVLPQRAGGNDEIPLERWRTVDLWRRHDLLGSAELQERLGAPLILLMLAALAPILGRSAPRKARFDRILIGLFLWICYVLFLSVGKDWMLRGKSSPALGLWWVHGAFLLIVLATWWPYWRANRAARRALQTVSL